MKKTTIIIAALLLSICALSAQKTTKKTISDSVTLGLNTTTPNGKLFVKGDTPPKAEPFKRIIKIDLDSILALNNVEINETFKGDSTVTFAVYTPSVYQSPSPNDSTTYMNINLNIQVRTERGDVKKAIQKRVMEMDDEIERENTKIQDRIKRREKFSKSN